VKVPSTQREPARSARVQHVWVDITAQWVHPKPGILLMWRRRLGQRGGWEAWVIAVDQAAEAHGGSPRVVQGWVDATHVRPAGNERPPIPTSSPTPRPTPPPLPSRTRRAG
jgi:hypothetical protein